MHIIIVGCGRVGARLATLLAQEKHDVVVIDKKKDSFERLGHGFNGITLKGVGFDLEVLEKAGIEKTDIFLALTNGDNSNLVCVQVAKKIYGVPRTIARIFDPQRARIYSAMGLEILSTTALSATMIKNLVLGNSLINYLPVDTNAEIIEFLVSPKMKGHPVTELNLTGEFQVAAIIRKNQAVLPGPEVILEAGDRIVGVALKISVDKIKKLYHFKEEEIEG